MSISVSSRSLPLCCTTCLLHYDTPLFTSIKMNKLFGRLKEVKRTYWGNHTYLRRSRRQSLRAAISSVVSGPTIFFYPQYPHENYIIRKLCAYGGIEVTSHPKSPYDVGFFFTDQTFSSPKDYGPVCPSFINHRCTDISKQNVQDVFENIFGYSLAIDPTVYDGPAIAKSNQNAKHDGRVVTCPIDAPGGDTVYQKRVDNRVEGDVFLDYRTTIVGDAVPTVVCKYWKCDDGKMPGTVVEAEAAQAHDVFTAEEVETIRQFAHAIGLDFGELDVLRDHDDGRIYIVDVNSTPIGPREELSDPEYHVVFERMLSALHKQFLYR